MAYSFLTDQILLFASVKDIAPMHLLIHNLVVGRN